TPEAVDAAETAVLGRKSPFSSVQRGLGTLAEDDRRRVGRRTDEVRTTLRAEIARRREELDRDREGALLAADRVDVTLPGRKPRSGSLHPLTSSVERVVEIFTGMGYRVVEGPEVE